MQNNNKPFAEIIESSLDSFLAQCWQWDNFPKFGSLVQVQNDELTILGCVVAVQTGSMDPMRYPFPHQKTLDELKIEQPQIFEFLKTTFTVKVLGYKETTPTYTLPPYPGKIHSFIELCPPTLAHEFFSKPDFLYLLFSSTNPIEHFDDLLLAILKQLASTKQLSNNLFDTFSQTLSLLTGNDYRRMKLLLKRVGSVTKP
ncbi:hypothetical protein KAT92_03030 [Candidatus Babeliales bacterium]|nr:hypothetical protein [Candidatus Babeliales bacterium]